MWKWKDDGDDRRHDMYSFLRRPNRDVLDRETKWELIGCIILLLITVSMAAAVNVYAP